MKLPWTSRRSVHAAYFWCVAPPVELIRAVVEEAGSEAVSGSPVEAMATTMASDGSHSFAEQMALCRAVLFEAQTIPGQEGGPIRVEGFQAADVNACVEVMFEEGLLKALGPGELHPDAWTARGITYAGLEFLVAYQEDSDAAAVLSRRSFQRTRSATMAELISTLAKALFTAD
jgi:hypothetical protein